MAKGAGKNFTAKTKKASGSVAGANKTVFGLKPGATKGTNTGNNKAQTAKWGK